MPHLVNGKVTDHISILDRGLQYGDGLFETILLKNSRLILWDEHIARLLEGCQRLSLEQPRPQLLATEAQQIIGLETSGVLKIIVTRGEGGRGYKIGPNNPTRIISLYPAPVYLAENASLGIQARICQTRLSINPTLAGLKHLNRLEQVLARSEWQEETITEGLILDTEDFAVEGTMSNVFIEKDGVFSTPLLDRNGVAGVMRKHLLSLISCQEKRITLPEVLEADSLFFCNSVIGIWPVKQLDNQTFTISEQLKSLQRLASAST